jgi:hypothetical protein
MRKIIKHRLVGGFTPSEKYEFVRLEYHPNYWGKSSSHVPNHQLVVDCGLSRSLNAPGPFRVRSNSSARSKSLAARLCESILGTWEDVGSRAYSY